MGRMALRLDQLLAERGLAATRSRARDLILRGLVRVDGAVAAKPAASVDPDAQIEVAPGHDYVSRSAEKLVAALEAFGFACAGRRAIDLGASTGGFTEVLLARGAARVFAVDVGRGQLHQSLRDDPRVVALEGLDARALTAARIPDPIDAIVADVSFVSLTKVLPVPLTLAAPGAWLAALIKPQFEAGPGHVGKGGIVRDAAARARAIAEVDAWLAAQQGWRVIGTCPSPIAGGDGNLETLIGAQFDG